MKSILILTDSINTFGGIQRCVCMLANNLIEQNYGVSIICTNNKHKDINLYNLNSSVKVFYAKNVTLLNKIICSFTKILEKLDNKYGCFRKNVKLQQFIYIKSRYSRNKDILKKIDDVNPDYVIGADGNYVILLGTYADKINAKLIGWQHSSCESYFNIHFKNRIKLYTESMNKMYQYVVLTQHDQKWIKNKFNYDCSYIYNFKSFVSNDVSKLTNKKMIAVGRLDKAKNYKLMIEGFKKFNEIDNSWCLDIYGNGPQHDVLLSLIKRYNLEEKIKIHSPVDNIKTKYLESSLFLICSQVEGFGLVLIEAMECGLPVITTNIPCFCELLNGNEGIILKNNNSDELANAIQQLTSSKGKMVEFSKNAKIRSQDFSDEKIIKQWKEILK